MLQGRLPDGAHARVVLREGVIAQVEPVEATGGAWILPGLVDLQVNGYAGSDVNADHLTTDTVLDLVHALWGQGVTAFCPTIITAPEAKIVHALRAVVEARRADPLVRRSIVGVHVEGPYLSAEDGPRGAHDPAFLRAPDLAELRRWQDAAEGLVRIVTLAPELPGALEYIAAATHAGVLVSVGHTAASSGEVRAAAAAGARLSTHLGNGAHPLIRRHPNYIWAQLADDRLTATFIADGDHLPVDTFTAMLRAKGLGRAVLVSDSASLAGQPAGEYQTPVGGSVTVHPDGRLTLRGGDLLAGSGRSLAQCAAWSVRTAGLAVSDVVVMTATNPARLLDLPPRRLVAPGHPADLTVLAPDAFENQVRVEATVVGGAIAYLSVTSTALDVAGLR